MEDEVKDSRERGWCLQKRKLEDGEERLFHGEDVGNLCFFQKNLWGE